MKLFNAFLSSFSLLAVTVPSNGHSLRRQQPSSAQSNDYNDNNAVEVTYLAGSNWAVTDLLINGDLEPTLTDSRMLTLHFHEESMTGLADLTGHGGCNSFHSQYELLFGIDFPQAFSVDDRVVSTRRFCEEEIMTQETSFQRVLAQEAIAYQIRAGKELELYNVVVDDNGQSNAGDLMAVLRRIPLDVDANASIPAVCTSDDQCSPTIRSQVSSRQFSGVGGCGCYASSEIDSFDECEGNDEACRTLRCGGDALFCNDMTAFCDIIPGDTMGQCQLGAPLRQSRTITVDFDNITHILSIGSNWEATTITGLDTPISTDDPITMFIESETSISGYSGCNSFNGALEFLDIPIVNGWPLFQISLTRGRSTRRRCDDASMKLERHFNSILSEESLAYSIGRPISDEPYGEQLSLYAVDTDEDGEPSRAELLVEFRRIPPPEDGDFMSSW